MQTATLFQRGPNPDAVKLTAAQRRFVVQCPARGWSEEHLTGSERAMARRLESSGVLRRAFLRNVGEVWVPTARSTLVGEVTPEHPHGDAKRLSVTSRTECLNTRSRTASEVTPDSLSGDAKRLRNCSNDSLCTSRNCP